MDRTIDENAPKTAESAPLASPSRRPGVPTIEVAGMMAELATRARGLAMVLRLAQGSADALALSPETTAVLEHARGNLDAMGADLERATGHFWNEDPGDIGLASGFEILSLPPECAVDVVRDEGRPMKPEELEDTLVYRFPGLTREGAVMARCNAVGHGLRRGDDGRLALAD